MVGRGSRNTGTSDRPGRIDYVKNAYCRGCVKIFVKPKLRCPDCNRKLKQTPTGTFYRQRYGKGWRRLAY